MVQNATGRGAAAWRARARAGAPFDLAPPCVDGTRDLDAAPYHAAMNPPESQPPTAHYTLPGVINYLTSEFTNLERYKIMTNLEKAEMRHKINLLQGELNALRYIGERQTARIAALERENAVLKGRDGVPGGAATGAAAADAAAVPASVPEVDLGIVKKLREQLARAMRDVVHLLRTPSYEGYDASPDAAPDADTSSQYDALFNSPPQTYPADPLESPPLGAFARYLQEPATTAPEGDLFGEIVRMENKSQHHSRSIDAASDAETVSQEEFDFDTVRSSSPTAKPHHDDAGQIATLSLARPGYAHARVFKGIEGATTLVYINLGHPKRRLCWLNVYDTASATLVAAEHTLTKEHGDIVDVYAITPARVCIVYANGTIETTEVKPGATASVLVALRAKVVATAAVAFGEGRFGIAFVALAQLRVYELSAEAVSIEEIGVFGRELFGAGSPFEAVGWYERQPVVQTGERLACVALKLGAVEKISTVPHNPKEVWKAISGLQMLAKQGADAGVFDLSAKEMMAARVAPHLVLVEGRVVTLEGGVLTVYDPRMQSEKKVEVGDGELTKGARRAVLVAEHEVRLVAIK